MKSIFLYVKFKYYKIIFSLFKYFKKINVNKIFNVLLILIDYMILNFENNYYY